MNSFARRSKSAVRTAVAVPACLLLAFGGTALMAAPAMADTAPSATATAAPADAGTATGAATATATAPATATASPSPSSTATAAPTSGRAVTPKPTSKLAPVKAPTDLTVTSPTPIDFSLDNQAPTQMTSRTFTIEGTAPVGSKLELTDWDGETLATLTTVSTTFSIPVTLPADAPYEQFLDLVGTHGRSQLSDVSFDLVFPAPSSAAPTLSAPSVTSFTVAPLPFDFGTYGAPVKVTGTGTPGDYVELAESDAGTPPHAATPPDADAYSDSPTGDSSQADVIPVAADGSWTGYVYLPYGTTDLWASQQQFREDAKTTVYDGEAITHSSPLSSPVRLTMSEPAGTVEAPEILKPADPDVVFTGGGIPLSSSAAVEKGTGALARTHETVTAARRAAAKTGHFGVESSGTTTLPSTGLRSASGRLVKAAEAARVGARAAQSPTDPTFDQQIAQDGIQVKGTPSTTVPGSVTTTVAGVGTPGDHIVVYAEDGDTAQLYVQSLYPEFFSTIEGLLAAVGSGDGTTPTVPPTFTAGTDTSLLPADDGTVTVAADGTWSATITRRPGSYGIMAFAVDPSTKVYSAASNFLGVHLTGPVTTTSTTTGPASTGGELAFTGSQHSTGIALGGLGAVVGGAALLVVARRRKRA